MGAARVITVRQGSIIDANTTCVVNASNDSATLGGGTSRAIFDECGGQVLQEEMRAALEDEFDGVLEEGDCLVTSAGTSSRFRWLLHVPSVDYRGHKAELRGSRVERTVTSVERVQACVAAALERAQELAVREAREVSVGFPLLGAGSGGLAPRTACSAMLTAMRQWFPDEPHAAIAAVVLMIPEPDRFVTCDRLMRDLFGEPG